jgi:diaminopimelate epimerase
MGKPEFAWEKVPLSRQVDTGDFPLDVDGTSYSATAVSIGNPHCVLFVNDADAAPVASLGPRIETLPLFPGRTNVEFVTVRDAGHLRMRVWERGAGVTLACGSGACAAAAAAHRRGLTGAKVEVLLDGGALVLEMRDGHALMTGPAALVYRGDVDLTVFAA